VPSIMQPWTMEIGLRHQGVLVSAMRGCDTAARHDHSKIAQRLLRGAVLIPHCGRFVNPATYILQERDPSSWWQIMTPFLESWDHYPNHYVVHFVHASEVIGYCAPEEFPTYPHRWKKFYELACHKLHLTPETKAQLDDRLNADEALFRERQNIHQNELAE
jgi:hypothetical protein